MISKEAVAELLLTSSKVLHILKKRFGNESQIITKNMEVFRVQEVVTNNQNLQASGDSKTK